MKRGEYLLKIIEDKGFSIMSLSKASGVAYTTIRSMIERDLVNASIDNVIKICKVLGISVDVFNAENVDEVQSIAAHHDGEDWTEEELEEIRKFKEFVLSKRKQQR